MAEPKKKRSTFDELMAEDSGAEKYPPGKWFLWSDGIYEAGEKGAAARGGLCSGAREVFRIEHDDVDGDDWEAARDGYVDEIASPEGRRLARDIKLTVAAPDLLAKAYELVEMVAKKLDVVCLNASADDDGEPESDCDPDGEECPLCFVSRVIAEQAELAEVPEPCSTDMVCAECQTHVCRHFPDGHSAPTVEDRCATCGCTPCMGDDCGPVPTPETP